MNFRRYIPAEWRLQYQLLRRLVRERGLIARHFAASRHANWTALPEQSVQTQQRIFPGTHFANKVTNIDQCIQALNGLVLKQGEVFAFWHLVPRPLEKNGFKTGRNLLNGVLSEDVGGGACQVSSIVYITALHAGMLVQERHAHSLDIYQEHERFTPLGADAAVVYGYKDLQFQNPLPHAVQLQLLRDGDALCCKLVAQQALAACHVHFDIEQQAQHRRVTTRVNERELRTDLYRLP